MSLSLGSVVAFGLPDDGQVVAGNAAIVNPNADRTEIHQSTDKAIINWRDFSIGQGQSVEFFVPGSTSATLNRITGGNASQILGSLRSNGQLWIINPNGIMFGPNAQVNVAGFVASTLNITNQDFLNGNYSLSQQGSELAKIVNQGHLSAEPSGFIALVAPQIENSGIIDAKLGVVAIGAAQSATLQISGNKFLQFSLQNGADVPLYNREGQSVAAITHTGEINANGGLVLLTAKSVNNLLDQSINVSGVIRANTAQAQQGKIILSASGDTLVTGNAQLSAQGLNTGEKGGEVQVLGNRVGVLDNANINTSGAAGGGQIRIGGDYQGANPDIQNAAQTYIGSNTVINASATKMAMAVMYMYGEIKRLNFMAVS